MDVIILGFFTAFFVVVLATPSLIKVAKMKHLVDEPSEERKLHSKSVPTIGGIIIFAAVLFGWALWFPAEDWQYDWASINIEEAFKIFKYLGACLLILFFVGVKDDIIGTAPVKKLMAHMVVGFILVLMADVKITSLHGIFGFEEAIPDWAQVILSVFVYIVIVNAFNLIDGVDGLAAGIGFVCCILFGVWFQMAQNPPLSLLAFVLAGALLGFLVFNFSPAKIFMGDSGSLVIGVIISVLAIGLIEQDTSLMPEKLQTLPTPILAMCILVYPLIDTLRIFIVRTLKGQSPFSADKNHIHHRLIRIGLSHAQTVLVLYTYNLIVVAIAVWAGFNFTIHVALGISIFSAIALIQIPFLIKPKEEEEPEKTEVEETA